MTDERLTDDLAVRVMGWKPALGRFVKSGRSWIPRWRFRPLTELADAFRLLDRAADQYTIKGNGHTFTAEIQVGGGRGTASGKTKARTITLALARALGIEAEP